MIFLKDRAFCSIWNAKGTDFCNITSDIGSSELQKKGTLRFKHLEIGTKKKKTIKKIQQIRNYYLKKNSKFCLSMKRECNGRYTHIFLLINRQIP